MYTCPTAQKKHLILTLALFVIVGYEQSNYKVVMVVNDYNCTFHQQTNNKVIMIMIDYNRTYYLESCRLLSVFSDVDRQLCSQALGVSLHQIILITRQSKHCGFSIYIFDNSKSKSMVRLVRAEKMVLSGLVFTRKIARMILDQNL